MGTGNYKDRLKLKTMMKIVISPAKSLDFETQLPLTTYTKPSFVKQSKEIHKVLKNLSPVEIGSLMGISDKLSELNWKRNQARKYRLNGPGPLVRQAVFAFNGDVYAGLDAYTLPEDGILYLQEHLRILSGLYGSLRPLDTIEAYRLEMGIKLEVNGCKDLYEFWRETVTASLNKGMKKGDVLVNLASNEYFGAVDVKKIKATVITPEFRDYKDGNLKMISFFAKRARGLMVRYMADNRIEKAEELKNFNVENYRFDAGLSTDTKWVFTR